MSNQLLFFSSTFRIVWPSAARPLKFSVNIWQQKLTKQEMHHGNNDSGIQLQHVIKDQLIIFWQFCFEEITLVQHTTLLTYEKLL